MNPFSVGETRVSVRGSDGDIRATVQIHVADAWPGSKLVDWVWEHTAGDELSLALTIVVELASIPARLRYWIRRKRDHNTEWEILIYDRAIGGYRPPLAKEIYAAPDREAAVIFAGQMYARLKAEQ